MGLDLIGPVTHKKRTWQVLGSMQKQRCVGDNFKTGRGKGCNPVLLTNGSAVKKRYPSVQSTVSTQPGTQGEDNRTISCGTCCWRDSSSGTYGWRISYWGASNCGTWGQGTCGGWPASETQETKLVKPAEEKEEELAKLTKKALANKSKSLKLSQGEKPQASTLESRNPVYLFITDNTLINTIEPVVPEENWLKDWCLRKYFTQQRETTKVKIGHCCLIKKNISANDFL